ncbi:MAG: DUF2794 domain-containing protein [Pseudomonadota bacterium]
MSNISSIRNSPSEKVAFHRMELNLILNVYGRLVRVGEARDYAIGMHPDRAIFAMYRRAAEQPTWRVEKVPALANRQGAYAVFGSAGQVLRRGRELKAVLRVFEKRRFEVVE